MLQPIINKTVNGKARSGSRDQTAQSNQGQNRGAPVDLSGPATLDVTPPSVNSTNCDPSTGAALVDNNDQQCLIRKK